MRSRGGAWLMALALIAASAPLVAAAPAPRRAKAPAAPKIGPPPIYLPPLAVAAETPGGLRVVVLPRRDVPLMHLVAVVKAGAEHDAPGRPGLAAAVAAMLREGGAGARSGQELAEAAESLGSQLRVITQRDFVAIVITVLDRHLERALELLADLLARPRFDAAEWTRTRARRSAQIQRQRDEPRVIANQHFDRALFGDQHPYGAPIDGTVAALEGFSVDDLKRFYAAHYGPRTTSLLLIGDLAAPRAVELAERAIGDWRSTAAPTPAPPVAPPVKPRLLLIDRPGAPQSELRIGTRGLSRASAEVPASRVLGMVLGGSFTSRLVQNLREKRGYTYGIRARFHLHRAPGAFVVSTAVRTDVTADAIGEIVKELRAIREPLSAAELAKGRALVLQELVDDFGDREGIGGVLADLVANDLPLDDWRRLPAALAALTPSGLAARARGLFLPDALTIVVLGDRRAIEAGLRALPEGKALELLDVNGNQLP